MKQSSLPSNDRLLQVGALCLACAISALSLGNRAFASEICGPKVIAESFVETKEDVWSAQEQKLKSGGKVVLKIEMRHTGAADDGFYPVLEFFDASNKNVKTLRLPKKEQHWSMLGAFATDHVLIATGEDRKKFLIFNSQGDVIAEHGVNYVGALSLADPALTLRDGSLLLLGGHQSTAIAAKLVEDKGVTWKASFVNDWESFYLRKAVELGDGSIILIANGMVRNSDNSTLDKTSVIRLSRDGERMWQKHYTNGFDDGLSDVVALPDGRLMFAGVSRLGDRYKGNKRYLWLFKTDRNGDLLEERLIYASEHSVGTDSGTLKPHPSGEVLASWAIWGPRMHDLQHQECTYIYESTDSYRSPK